MTHRHGSASVSITMAFMGLTMLCACEKPVVGQLGSPVTAGGVEFSVADYSVRRLELNDGDETVVYDKPVLAIPITLTNKGKKPLPYNPSHGGQQMNEGTTPLLYLDPGADAELPPATKTAIKGIVLTKGKLPGQVKELRNIAPGESLQDTYLFEVPPKTTGSLILSLPPVWHKGKIPVLMRIPYQPKTPQGPKVSALGEAVAVGQGELTVKSAKLAYIKIKDTVQGEGYSTDPLLRIDYSIKNTGDEEIVYEPNHRSTGDVVVAKLISPEDGSHKRAQFAASASPQGQLKGRKTIPAGASIDDYLLFAMPRSGVSNLTLEYPAAIFSQPGIARVQFEYDATKPAQPEEMKKKKKAPKKEEAEKEEGK